MMKLPNKTQSIYSQLKMLEPTMRYVKDSLNDTDIQDLEIFEEMTLICAHLKSLLVKMEHTSARNKCIDDGN